MANLLDLSKFKKVRVEKDHTVLRHPHGHEIRVLHAPLSSKVKEKLDSLPVSEENNPKLQQAYKKPIKMADGGDVLGNPFRQGLAKGKDPKPSPAPVDQSQQSKYDAIRQQNKSNMGYADGGPVKPVQTATQSAQDSMRKAFHFSEGTPDAPVGQSTTAEDPAHAFLDSYFASKYQKDQPQEDKAVVPPTDQGMAVASPEVPQQPEAPIAPAAVPPEMASQPTGSLLNQSNVNTERENQAATQMGANTQQAETTKAQAFGQQAKQDQELHQKYQQLGNDIHQKFENTAQEVSQGKIDPSHWWDSKSTGSKVATAIGMLFAGAGGGISGHPELVGNIINNFIDRDIESQKANLNNKNSLLGKYMEMYNSLPQAESAARLTLGAATEGLVNQAAAKLGSQNAMAAAQQWIANNRQKQVQNVEGLAKAQVMADMYGNMSGPQKPASSDEQAYQDRMQSMRVLNPDIGKDMETKYLPNVGISRVPIPDKLREELTTRRDLSDKLSQLENFTKQHSGSLDPKTIKQGKAMAAQIQDAYRTAHQQGVFKESEKNFLESVLHANPTSFFANIRALPGYQEAHKFNDQTIKQFYKSYGIKPFANSDQGTIRVKLNSTGQTGSIPANEFDSKIYSKVE